MTRAVALVTVFVVFATATSGRRHQPRRILEETPEAAAATAKLVEEACPAESVAHPHGIPPVVYYTGKFDINLKEFVNDGHEGHGKWPDNYVFYFYDDAALNASMRSLDAVLRHEGVVGAWEAFDALKPVAFKADLWRYCLIWACGGHYLDSKMKIALPFWEFMENTHTRNVKKASEEWTKTGHTGPKPTLITCIDRWVSRLDQYQNITGIWQGLLIGTRRHPDLLLAIEHVIRNVEARIYPRNEGNLQMLYITGPGAFARATQWPDPEGWEMRIHLPCHWGNHGAELRTIWGSGQVLAMMDSAAHMTLKGGAHLSYGEMYKRNESYVDGNPRGYRRRAP